MSRSLIIGVIVTLVLLIGMAIFFYTTYIKVQHKAAIEAVPRDAALILELDDVQQTWATLTQTDIWKDLSKNEAIASLHSQLTYLDSMVRIEPKLQAVLDDNTITISFHSNKGAQLSILWVAETHGNANETELIQAFSSIYKLQAVKRSFDKEIVYDLINAQQQPVLTIACKDQLLLVSADGTLVEEGIRKLKYNFTNNTKGFEQARAIAEVNSDVNMYLNYQYLPALLALLQKSEYKTLNNYLKSFANWSVLNVGIEKEYINMSGATFTDDSVFQFLDLFKTQTPFTNDVSASLPLSTAFALQFNFSNYVQFHSDLNEYLQNEGVLDSYLSYVDSVEERYRISITDRILPLVGKSVVLGLYENTQAQISDQVFALLHFDNLVAAEEVFNSYANEIEKRGEGDSSQFMFKGKIIKRLNMGNALKGVYGKYLSLLVNPFYVATEKGILLANNLTVLQQILDEMASGAILASSVAYANQQKQSGSGYNVSVYVNPGKCLSIPSFFGTDEWISAFNRYQYDIKKFEYISVQYANSGNNTFFTNVHYQFNPSFKEETKLLWSARLDTSLLGKPTLVYNSELNQNCILVQDSMNQLYFINQAGSILWKTKLNGPILSQVYSVDFSKNGTIGYLFNTSKQVYLIGSNGNNVYGYPIRLPGSTQVGISLIDFYKDSSYQFFVPLTNNRIVGYALNGKPISGWNPKIVPNKITTGIKGFVVNRKPYVCGITDNNRLWVQQLKGKEVVITDDKIARSGIEIDIEGNDSLQAYIWVADSSNALIQYKFDTLGMVYKVNEVKINKPFMQLSWKGNYILTAGHNQWTLTTKEGKELTSQSVSDSSLILSGFSQSAANEPYISYTDKLKQKVFWVNFTGNNYPTLPLEGSSAFIAADLLNNKSNYIIVADSLHNLRVYKLK